MLLEAALNGSRTRTEHPGIPLAPGQQAREAVAAVDAALGQLARPRLLHGPDASAWEFVEVAARRRHDTRTGFEDTLALPDGSRAENNAALVAAARRLIANRG